MTKQHVHTNEFVCNLLELFDHEYIHDLLFWRTGKIYGGGLFNQPASFFINCNDLFWWATADLEEITEDNLEVLRQSIADCKAVDPVCGAIDGCNLFCCRVRQLRPQHAAYPKKPELWPLFDAAGPERTVDFGNPYQHPVQGLCSGNITLPPTPTTHQ